MTTSTLNRSAPASSFDLILTRVVEATPRQLWKAWTTPEILKQWFAPKPWTTVECELNLRAGGLCRTVMRSPDGQDYPNTGCYLEVVENKRIVFTDALGADFRPAAEPFFTAIITFEPEGGGTRYTARALHKNEADRQKHEAMGFHEGWGQCLDQLVAVAKKL